MLRADYDARYPGLKVEGQGMYAGLGQYHDQVRQITRTNRATLRDDRLVVDPQALLADDVTAPPEWDVKAEKDFRQWAVARLRADPPVFDMYPDHDDEIVSGARRWGPTRPRASSRCPTCATGSLRSTRHGWSIVPNGARSTRPTGRPLRPTSTRPGCTGNAGHQQGEQGLVRRRHRPQHHRGGGEGDQDYPSIRQWDEPKRLIDQAGPARAGQFELAVPLLAMAELATAQAAQRIFAYDNRVETGAAVAVKSAWPGLATAAPRPGTAAGLLGIGRRWSPQGYT
ncbi:MAG: hypothetical protein U0R72_15340 [Nakamurella multipartita]